MQSGSWTGWGWGATFSKTQCSLCAWGSPAAIGISPNFPSGIPHTCPPGRCIMVCLPPSSCKVGLQALFRLQEDGGGGYMAGAAALEHSFATAQIQGKMARPVQPLRLARAGCLHLAQEATTSLLTPGWCWGTSGRLLVTLRRIMTSHITSR